MNIKLVSTSIGLVASSILAISNTAQAANFTTNFEQKNGVEGDTILKSITQNGKKVESFSYVKKADILENTLITGVKKGQTSDPEAVKDQNLVNNTGAASTDKGDKASSPDGMAISGLNNPTGKEIAAFLGNNNLSNIIDTEDAGTFKINLFFDSLIRSDGTGLDSLFFWERNLNSDLGIQAVDGDGKLIGKALKLLRKDQVEAGFSIDTTEISSAQKVGSWGVNLEQLGVKSLAGIQVFADQKFNGPDFKVIARKTGVNSKNVPEPTTLFGLGVVSGLAFIKRKNKS
jgi:hypothetical protein